MGYPQLGRQIGGMGPRMTNKIWFLSQVYLNFIAYEIRDTIAGHKSDWSQVHIYSQIQIQVHLAMAKMVKWSGRHELGVGEQSPFLGHVGVIFHAIK